MRLLVYKTLSPLVMLKVFVLLWSLLPKFTVSKQFSALANTALSQ